MSVFWIKRSGNAAAHEVAKYTIQSCNSFSFSFLADNLPVPVASVCLGDVQALSVSVF